jgi:hypothetical protein
MYIDEIRRTVWVLEDEAFVFRMFNDFSSALHVLRNSGDSAILMEYAFCYPKQEYTYIRRIDRDGGMVDIMNLNT